MLWWTLRQARSPDAKRRAEALATLVQDGRPEARRAVLAALDDTDSSIRKLVLAAAPTIAGAEAAELLMRKLVDPDPWVRAAAVDALGETKSTAAVPKLIEMLRGADLLLRSAAATALGRIGDRSAIRPLAGTFAVTGNRAMESALVALDPDWRNSPEATALARQVLAKLDHAAAVPAPAPPRPVVRPSAPREASERAREKVEARAQRLEQLLTKLAGGDESAREAAARKLAESKDRVAIGPLVRALADESPKVRRAARVALDALDSKWTAAQECHAQREYLFSSLAAGGELYWEVVRSLEAIDPKWAEYKSARAAIPHLAVASTGDGEPGWHPSRTPPGHARELLEQLDKEWPRTREAFGAVPALIGLFAEWSTSPARADRIGALLDRIDGNWRARDACREVAACLLPTVADAHAPEDRRLAATVGLGWLGDPGATNALTTALDVALLRDTAIVAIGRSGDALAVPRLLALAPVSGRASLELASSLGRLQAPESIPRFLALLNGNELDGDDVVARLEKLLAGDCAWVDESDLRSLSVLADLDFNKLTEDWTTEQVHVYCSGVREAAARELARRDV